MDKPQIVCNDVIEGVFVDADLLGVGGPEYIACDIIRFGLPNFMLLGWTTAKYRFYVSDVAPLRRIERVRCGRIDFRLLWPGTP